MTFIIPMNSSVITVIEDFRPVLQDIVKYKPFGGVYYLNLRDGTVTDRRFNSLVTWRRPRAHIPCEKMYTIDKSQLKDTILERYNRIVQMLEEAQEHIEYEYKYDRDVTYTEYVLDMNRVIAELNQMEDKIDAMKST